MLSRTVLHIRTEPARQLIRAERLLRVELVAVCEGLDATFYLCVKARAEAVGFDPLERGDIGLECGRSGWNGFRIGGLEMRDVVDTL